MITDMQKTVLQAADANSTILDMFKLAVATKNHELVEYIWLNHPMPKGDAILAAMLAEVSIKAMDARRQRQRDQIAAMEHDRFKSMRMA